MIYKTFYGYVIVERVPKHQFEIEEAILNTAAEFGESEWVALTDGRSSDITVAVRDAMNDVLIRNEDFGGIEEMNLDGGIL